MDSWHWAFLIILIQTAVSGDRFTKICNHEWYDGSKPVERCKV